jgi:hypothetical protein
MKMQDRKILNVREAADYIRLSKSFLDKARVSGEGPAYLLIGRRVVYDRDDLDTGRASIVAAVHPTPANDRVTTEVIEDGNRLVVRLL